jgi:rod shape-determining protein MreB
MGLIQQDIAIDMGTSFTRVYLRGKGLVLSEPTIALVETNGQENFVHYIGEDASMMVGRAKEEWKIISPVQDGVIEDFDIAVSMLTYFIRKAIGKHNLVGPRVIIGIPSNISQVEKRVIRQALRSAGAKTVRLIPQVFAAAKGTGLPVYEPEGNMVVDIGGGMTEVAVISLTGSVVSKSARIGGKKMDDAIMNYIKREHNILIGERTAEDVKLDLGAALPLDTERRVLVRGRDIVTNLPQTSEISSTQVYEALRDPCMSVLGLIQWVMEHTPPELGGDIMRNGIHLTGGGALLLGLDRYIAEELGIPVLLAKNPMDCVISGLGYLADHYEMLERESKRGFFREE